MQWKQKLDHWLERLHENDPLKIELMNHLTDDKQLEEFFYKDLEFGTGGMRGIMGPGTNRINTYTVRKVAYGLALYIASQGIQAKTRGIVIAYDSRHLSPEFAMEVARTVGYQGIQVYLFEQLRPTPLLSFAVRHLNAYAGVMITASHNPPAYNGLKVYGQDGAQLPPTAADTIIGLMNEVKSELAIEVADVKQLEKDGLLTYISTNVDKAYTYALEAIQLNEQPKHDNLSIVFTALHGTGAEPMKKAFEEYGFTDVKYVTEQCSPDPDFTTVKSPNPEEAAAFELAIQYGRVRDADVLLATDPDADRLGVAVKDGADDYVLLTGNQIGAVMIKYLLEQKKQNGTLPQNGVIMKTIVTTELARAIADKHGVEIIDTLTGFKFIAEKIHEFEKSKEKTFLFGFEESYGFLIGDFVRDKDAVQAALFIAEAASFYKEQGKSLNDVLIELFEELGYYKEATCSVTLEGKDGSEQIERIMDSFRAETPSAFGDVKVVTVEDYLEGVRTELSTGEQTRIDLPKSDVVKFVLEDDSWICVRPSGTEPKCKFYFGVKGTTSEEAEVKLSSLQDIVLQGMNS